MRFVIVGDGWSAARFRSVIDARGWSSETVRLPRERVERTKALRCAARCSGGASPFIVTSPPSVQVNDARTLAAEGARVLVEKPVGLGVDAVRELRTVARTTNAWVLAAYHLAVNPLVMRLRTQEIASSIGDIQHARFRMDVHHARPVNEWLHDPSLSGGVIVETLVHGFHLLDFLVGPIDSVLSAQQVHGRAATILLRHVSGATSSVEGVWGARASTRRGHVELFGAQGAAGLYRGDKLAYELHVDGAHGGVVSWKEHDEDVGFGILLEGLSAETPPSPALEAAAGLEGAERALDAALVARALATGATA